VSSWLAAESGRLSHVYVCCRPICVIYLAKVVALLLAHQRALAGRFELWFWFLLWSLVFGLALAPFCRRFTRDSLVRQPKAASLSPRAQEFAALSGERRAQPPASLMAELDRAEPSRAEPSRAEPSAPAAIMIGWRPGLRFISGRPASAVTRLLAH